jgi:hypothetical protein
MELDREPTQPIAAEASLRQVVTDPELDSRDSRVGVRVERSHKPDHLLTSNTTSGGWIEFRTRRGHRRCAVVRPGGVVDHGIVRVDDQRAAGVSSGMSNSHEITSPKTQKPDYQNPEYQRTGAALHGSPPFIHG